MIPDSYVWLVWSGLFLLVWLLLFALFPRYRLVMWWSSVLSVPFGMSEPLFLGRYWSPPSLFHLARTAHFDLETFVFCFGIGGVAGVAYNLVTGRPVRWRPGTEWGGRGQGWYVAALGAPLLPFGAVLLLAREPIWAGIAGLAAGALARVVVRPDLTPKVVLGGLFFLAYYIGFLLILEAIAPGYLGRTWNARGPAHEQVFGLPLTEMFFALTFGLEWSGLVEQIDWTFTLPGTSGPPSA